MTTDIYTYEVRSSGILSARPTSQLVTVLESGIAKVRSLAPDTGDAHMRIEKYLLRQVSSPPELPIDGVWPAQILVSRSTSAPVTPLR